MFYLLVGVALLGLLIAVAPRVLRRESLDEVQRFHRARRLTTEWARAGAVAPRIAYDELEDREVENAGG